MLCATSTRGGVLPWNLDERRTEFVMCWPRVYAWLCVKIKAKGTGIGGVLPWSVDHRRRVFVMCWLRVYAWLRVKIKAKVTGVGGVLPWNLDERSTEFVICWLRVYAWLASKLKLRVPVLGVFCRGAWMKERGSFVIKARKTIGITINLENTCIYKL